MDKQSLEEHIKTIAERVLKLQNYVTVIDVLLETGHLQFAHLDRWQRGEEPFLERVLQADRKKIKHVIRCFQEWAEKKGLEADEAKYFAKTCGPNKKLVFSKDSLDEIETLFKTYYFSIMLSKGQKQKIHDKLTALPELVVFSIIKESTCNKCGHILNKGNFLFKEQDHALCMKCARLENMVFLPSGDVKLTRRAKKYTKRYAVVVKFSRARKRYERQGLLVEEAAIKQAESELEGSEG